MKLEQLNEIRLIRQNFQFHGKEVSKSEQEK